MTSPLEWAAFVGEEPYREEDSGRTFMCLKCRGRFHVDFELEPAPLCNSCADEALSSVSTALIVAASIAADAIGVLEARSDSPSRRVLAKALRARLDAATLAEVTPTT